MNALILTTVLNGKPPLYLRHHSPGRLRIGGAFLARPRDELVDHLQAASGVTFVQQNTLTGSLLVLYEKGGETRVFKTLLNSLPGSEGTPAGLKYIKSLTHNVNQFVYSVTGGWFDAQLLIPILLGVYGANRLLVQRRSRLPGALALLWWSYSQLWALSHLEEREPC